MTDYFTDHPMINMFKKAWENPMAVFQHNMELMQNSGMKGFNPMNMMESMPWMNMMSDWKKNMSMNTPLHFTESLKNLGDYADVQKLSLENSQAVLRRQAEIIQKNAEELYKLMQYAVSSRDPKETMNKQSEYMKSTFDVLVADFKELVEMYSKASMDTFNAASSKFSERVNSATGEHCDSSESCKTSSAKSAKPAAK